MKKSLISSLIAVAILCSGSTVAFASPQNTNSKQNATVDYEQGKNPIVVSNHTNLNYAIQEMTEAGNLFKTADFTDFENYNRMIVFAKTSLDRIRSLDIYNHPENWTKYSEWSKDSQDNIAWIEEEGNKINDASYRIARIKQAIENVETVFAPEREDTRENKENVINSLNLVLTQEVKAGVVNQTTLRNAVSIMHKYNNKLNGNKIVKINKIKLDDATIEYNHDHLNFAIQEMKKANNLFNEADFTNQANYNKMIVFATSALDRVRSLDIYKNTGNWAKNCPDWAEAAKPNISWIENTGNEIRNLTYRINRVDQAINNVKTVFAPARQDIKANKENVINTLNTVINQEKEAGVVNNTTLTAATKIMNQYKALIK